MNMFRIVHILIIFFIASSCKAPVQENTIKDDPSYVQSFIQTNKYIRERNREYIMAFIDRVDWKMIETPTGLWYTITENGKGDPVETDKLVSYTYETRLITGRICYMADTISPKKIVVGKGNIEKGLEEGLLLLREGSSARFIIPPYLAHGNFGDGDKIPGSSILLIEVKILEVKR
jgi:FKBP-type peptidyl-prolyl cis-trans isomerase